MNEIILRSRVPACGGLILAEGDTFFPDEAVRSYDAAINRQVNAVDKCRVLTCEKCNHASRKRATR